MALLPVYHNFWQPKLRNRHKPDHLPPECEYMLSELGLNGREETYKCPFMKVAFANAMKPDYEEDIPLDEEERTTLFDQGWDGQLVFTPGSIDHHDD